MEYGLAAPAILAAWETGARRRPLDRALAILWAAGASEHCDPANLPITERDRLLLSIRADSFGPTLPACTTCPDCRTELEMELDVNSLLETLPPANGGDGTLRPLTSRDLAAVCDVSPDKLASALRARLLVREVVGAEAEALDRRIEEEAGAAELTIRITCSECSAQWSETLDVATHVWAEIETTAMRLLGEVCELAATFGWTEGEILSLSPARRRVYLSRARRA